MIYSIYREQHLKGDLETIWKFFSSPYNLEKITPKDMGFVVRSKLPDDAIYEDMIIEYTVSPILSIPLKWRTRITEVVPLQRFIDFQERGPYKLWEHTHTFTPVDDGVLITDHVRYQLPLGPLGILAHKLFVRKKLNNIFDYRYQVLDKNFNQNTPQL
ncbi:SRPBCC family protein [Sphingobacterium sp. lm-10]|uniref:SRPBCC family protein n=1 Tax=Sphingobacterium sp. lm-10 TaxID=2944904 RepID=UPI002021BBBD|nr:SRPBCC family protein [Sphingobacterium sp. lm-10]MCL7986897.1 SRPBCC family protein [Sphingobacterium sp. lm-10]